MNSQTSQIKFFWVMIIICFVITVGFIFLLGNQFEVKKTNKPCIPKFKHSPWHIVDTQQMLVKWNWGIFFQWQVGCLSQMYFYHSIAILFTLRLYAFQLLSTIQRWLFHVTCSHIFSKDILFSFNKQKSFVDVDLF